MTNVSEYDPCMCGRLNPCGCGRRVPEFEPIPRGGFRLDDEILSKMVDDADRDRGARSYGLRHGYRYMSAGYEHPPSLWASRWWFMAMGFMLGHMAAFVLARLT